jgi:hypothetical protein
LAGDSESTGDDAMRRYHDVVLKRVDNCYSASVHRCFFNSFKDRRVALVYVRLSPTS